VLDAFPRDFLKIDSRANSVGTEDVNRERMELETAFPGSVIIHHELNIDESSAACVANAHEVGLASAGQEEKSN
jgi:hypothetical protein